MRRILCSCALSAALLWATVPAAAQAPRPGRPYRGLFASGTADATQLLTASGSFGGGYDNDLLADARGGSTASGGQTWRGGLGNFSGGLSYSLQEDGFTVSASAATSARYYPSLERKFLHGSSGSLSISAPLGTRAGLSLGAGVSYQPYTFSALFPTGGPSPIQEAATPDLDTAVDGEPYVAYQANAGLSFTLSNRTSLSAGANYRAAATSRTAAGNDFTRYGGGLSLSHNIGRGLDLRLGYAQSVAKYDEDREITNHAIDAGVDYSRALSISRRTTLSFSTGTALTQTGASRRFRIIGGASLQHEIGRSWHASLGYGRRVTVQESWLEPVMSDGISLTLGGLLTRRLQFNASANGALGTVGTESNSPGFDNVNARASLSMALTRFMNLGVTYAYYHHQFDEGAALPVSVRPLMDRQSIRASVSLWAPLVTLTRRSNASR